MAADHEATDDDQEQKKVEALKVEPHGTPESESQHQESEGAKESQDDEDDDETCGFCRFMKAGGCKKEFNAWSSCVDNKRGEDKNFAEECREETLALQRCMEEHRDYYRDFILEADQESQALASEPEAAASPDSNDSPGPAESKSDAMEESGKGDDETEGHAQGSQKEGDLIVAEATEMVAMASADVDVDEPLPPTETVLSGIEGDFQPGKGESQEKEKGGEGDKDEGGDGEESEEGGELKDEEQGSEEAEEEEPEEDPPVVEVKTAAHDPRFPSTNQARHCYTRYNEYHRCVAQKGEDAPECSVFQRAYRSLCPSDWLERWNEQREEGTWPGRY